MGISNSKRPHHIENYLYKTHTDNALNHLHVLKELSDECPILDNFIVPNNLNQFLIASDPLLNSTQKILSCLTKKALQENADVSEEKLYYGEKNLQEIFTPVKALSKSSYSIATVVGYKGSDPYAVLKFGGLREEVFKEEGILHEIVVGLILNKLRTKTPGFMYTYGGFYCAPPVKIHEYYKLQKDNHKNILEINRKYRIPEEISRDIQAREIEFEYDEEGEIIGGELNSYELPLDNPDYFINYFMYNYYNNTLVARFLTEGNKQTLSDFKDKVIPIYKKLLKSKYFRSKELDNSERLQHYKSLIKEKIDIINSITPEEIVEDKKVNNNKIEPPFSPEHFCNSTEDKTTLVLLEFISNSISLDDFTERDNIDEDERVNVRVQIILSLFIAFREYKFLPFDLHGGNILVRMFNKPQTIKYILQLYNKDKHDYEIIEYNMQSKYVAQIIDFGDTYLEYNNIALPKFEDERIKNITDHKILGAMIGEFKELQKDNTFRKIVSKLNDEYVEYMDLSREEKQLTNFKNFKLDNFIREIINLLVPDTNLLI